MKIKKSYIIAPVVIIGILSLIVFKLRGNKQELQNKVAMAQVQVSEIPVSIESAKHGSLNDKVVATGLLEASDVLTLVSETQGRIVKIYKEKGATVSAGEVIVKVDDEVLSANVLSSEANLEQQEKDLERFKRLSQENAVTKHDVEKLEIAVKKAKADLISARKALSNTSIKAPIPGYINNDFITLGQVLGGGSQICEIVNNNTLRINIKVGEKEVYKLKNGQSVTVRLSVFPDKSFTGTISSIAEKADAAMKFNIEIALSNSAEAHLKSGLYAEVELPVKNDEKLLINKTAIIGSMQNPEVFVVVNNRAEKRSLVIGSSNDAVVEVLSGISEGEQVIVSGQLNLRNGDAVKVITK